MNARIQGLYRLYRGLQDNPVSFMLRGSMVAGATLLLLARNWDDERYEDLPDWQKDIYWHIFIGDQHFAIPKPFEAGVIFGSMPERIARVAAGRDDFAEDFFKNYLATTVGETFAMNPIPQVFKPAVEQWANKQFFGQRQIVPLYLQGLDAPTQYRPWTSVTARWIAEKMPESAPEWVRSPVRIEHLVRGYLGTIGLYMMRGADGMVASAAGYPERPASEVYDLAPIRRFYRSGQVRGTRYEELLWEGVEEGNRAFRTINALTNQGRRDEARSVMEQSREVLARRDALNDVATQVRRINDAQRQIMYSLMDGETKKERLDQLQEQKNALLRRTIPSLHPR